MLEYYPHLVMVAILLFSLVSYPPLDIIKLICRYVLSGQAWALMTEQKVFFTRKKNFGQQARQAQWATISHSSKKRGANKESKSKLYKAKSFIHGKNSFAMLHSYRQ